jgi:hypothetical protein
MCDFMFIYVLKEPTQKKIEWYVQFERKPSNAEAWITEKNA